MAEWHTIQQKYKNSVLQIRSTRANYNSFRPYVDGEDSKSSGSGFIVDITKGIVITNAHVVSNALSISARANKLGKRDINLKLIGICREKDLAACLLDDESKAALMEGVKDPQDLNMRFGDSLELSQTDDILVIGYPLGQENIKFTTGIVAGFYANVYSPEEDGDEDEDTLSEEYTPSYIAITAGINHGNSGGPLLSKKGEVIGIVAAGYLLLNNIGYAIPSRTLLAIYPQLVSQSPNNSINSLVLRTPKYAFEWSRTTDELIELKTSTSSSSTQGIYVRKVHPDSVFSELQVGDIITDISYQDSIFENVEVTGKLDNYGDIQIESLCSNTNDCRRLTIKELFDMIPIGSDISLKIYRDQKAYVIQENTFEYVDSSILKYVYPIFQPELWQYRIFAGLCVMPLFLNHVLRSENLKQYTQGKKRYEQRLIITQIFPETTVARLGIFYEGDLIKRVNGKEVSTLGDLIFLMEKEVKDKKKREKEKKSKNAIEIESEDGSLFILSVDKMKQEDQQAKELFNISDSSTAN